MDQNGRPRRRFSTPAVEPTTITECARRYHSCAVALAKSFGLTLTVEFVQTYHPAISTVFIESSKVGVRLPERVPLPPLAPDAHASPETEPPSVSEGMANLSGAFAPPEPEPDRDTPPPGEASPNGAVLSSMVDTLDADDVPDFPPPPDQEPPPLPTRIPVGDNWPCAGHEITQLKPAQLHLVLAKAGFRAHADTTLMPLLAALQIERAQRLERGKRRNGEGPQG